MKKQDNPDSRNEGGRFQVRVYFRTNREHIFPTHEIHKAKIILCVPHEEKELK